MYPEEPVVYGRFSPAWLLLVLYLYKHTSVSILFSC